MTQKKINSGLAGYFIICMTVFLVNSCGPYPSDRKALINPLMEKPQIPETPSTPVSEGMQDEAEKTEQALLRLSLSQAVKFALEGNRSIEVASYNPRQAVQALKGAESIYDLSIFTNGTIRRTERPVQSQLDTGSILDDAFIEDRWMLQAGIRKPLITGGLLSLFQEIDHMDSNSELMFPNPQSTSRMRMELTQPMLKGIFDKENRSAIEIAKLDVDISNEEFRQIAMNVISETIKSYWQIFLESELVDISAEALDMTKEVMRRETARLEEGIVKIMDVDRAKMSVDIRQTDLLNAENRARIALDNLKFLLNLPANHSDSKIIPDDSPLLEYIAMKQKQLIEKALNKRPEIILARKAVETGRLRLDAARHNRLPRFDAKFGYTMNGQDNSEGKALEDIYTGDRHSWEAGLEFEWPLGGRGANAEYNKKRLEYEQALADMKRIKEQISHEVTQAVHGVDLAWKEIEIVRQIKASAEKVLKSENALFKLGQTSNQELLRAQNQLASASQDYMRAVINYNIRLTMLDHVQGILLEKMGIQISEDKSSSVFEELH